MRYKLSSLEKKEDRFFWNDTPFFGVAYEVNDQGEIAAIWNIGNGENVGPHVDDWAEGKRRFDVDRIERDAENGDAEILVDGEIVSECVLCHFTEMGMLAKEAVFPDGQPKRVWNEKGQLTEFMLDDERRKEWFDNGRIKVLSNEYRHFTYDEDGCVCSIHSRGGDDIMSWPPLIAAKVLTVSGSITDNDLCHRILGLPEVRELTLEGTQITAQGLGVFLQCKDLEKITIDGNNGFTTADAKRIADSITNCVLLDKG